MKGDSMTDTRRGDWIQTFTGKQYWPLDPRPEEVDILDIAHALSMVCRYAGHCERFYSVAEHSVHVSYLVPTELALEGLLHDASEAYIQDIARPVKKNLRDYAAIEARNEHAIAERFNLGTWQTHSHDVKHADLAICVAEQAVLMKPPPAPWDPVDVPANILVDAHDRLATTPYGWSPAKAERLFLARFRELAP